MIIDFAFKLKPGDYFVLPTGEFLRITTELGYRRVSADWTLAYQVTHIRPDAIFFKQPNQTQAVHHYIHGDKLVAIFEPHDIGDLVFDEL